MKQFSFPGSHESIRHLLVPLVFLAIATSNRSSVSAEDVGPSPIHGVNADTLIIHAPPGKPLPPITLEDLARPQPPNILENPADNPMIQQIVNDDLVGNTVGTYCESALKFIGMSGVGKVVGLAPLSDLAQGAGHFSQYDVEEGAKSVIMGSAKATASFVATTVADVAFTALGMPALPLAGSAILGTMAIVATREFMLWYLDKLKTDTERDNRFFSEMNGALPPGHVMKTDGPYTVLYDEKSVPYKIFASNDPEPIELELKPPPDNDGPDFEVKPQPNNPLTGGNVPAGIKPIQVKATGRIDNPTLRAEYALVFWNVGAMQTGHDEVVYTAKITVKENSETREHSFRGVFSGGPNGTFRFEANGVINEFPLQNGQSAEPGIPGLVVEVEDENAFADWPKKY